MLFCRSHLSSRSDETPELSGLRRVERRERGTREILVAERYIRTHTTLPVPRSLGFVTPVDGGRGRAARQSPSRTDRIGSSRDRPLGLDSSPGPARPYYSRPVPYYFPVFIYIAVNCAMCEIMRAGQELRTARAHSDSHTNARHRRPSRAAAPGRPLDRTSPSPTHLSVSGGTDTVSRLYLLSVCDLSGRSIFCSRRENCSGGDGVGGSREKRSLFRRRIFAGRR